MKNRIIAMVLGLALGATSANAATITDQFSFLDSSNAVIASGANAKKRIRIAIHARCSAARGGITRADPQQHEQ